MTPSHWSCGDTGSALVRSLLSREAGPGPGFGGWSYLLLGPQPPPLLEEVCLAEEWVPRIEIARDIKSHCRFTPFLPNFPPSSTAPGNSIDRFRSSCSGPMRVLLGEPEGNYSLMLCVSPSLWLVGFQVSLRNGP